MSTRAIPVPQGAVVDPSAGAIQHPTPFGKPVPLPPGASLQSETNLPASEEPTEYNDQARKLGYFVNDVGNKVIVPKDGEEFADTMKRATQHGKLLVDHQGNLTAQGNDEFNREESTMPEKTGETLGAAATIGVAGPAALAVPNEIGLGIRALTHAPIGMAPPVVRALPHLIKMAAVMRDLGVGAVGLHILKELISSKE